MPIGRSFQTWEGGTEGQISTLHVPFPRSSPAENLVLVRGARAAADTRHMAQTRGGGSILHGPAEIDHTRTAVLGGAGGWLSYSPFEIHRHQDQMW